MITTTQWNAARKLARLLRKAGTSAADAADRIQAAHKLSNAELRAILVATWGNAATLTR